MIEDVLERNVNTRYGTFHFELIESSGPSPLIDIYFEGKHLGYADYINLGTASDMEMLQLANEIKYSEEDDY